MIVIPANQINTDILLKAAAEAFKLGVRDPKEIARVAVQVEREVRAMNLPKSREVR